MPFKVLSENLSESGQRLQDYLHNSAEYYKLRLFKSTMKFATSLTNMLLLGSVFMLFLLFFSFAMAFWIGEAIGGIEYGLFIVGAFYLVVFILILLYAKPVIEKKMLVKFSDLMFDDTNESAEENMFKDDVSIDGLEALDDTFDNENELLK